MIYHSKKVKAMELDEVYEILSDYFCSGSDDSNRTVATFSHTIEKFEGAMEIARKLVAAKI